MKNWSGVFPNAISFFFYHLCLAKKKNPNKMWGSYDAFWFNAVYWCIIYSYSELTTSIEAFSVTHLFSTACVTSENAISEPPPLPSEKKVFIVDRTLDKDASVIRVFISNIPFKDEYCLKPRMVELFQQYGLSPCNWRGQGFCNTK